MKFILPKSSLTEEKQNTKKLNPRENWKNIANSQNNLETLTFKGHNNFDTKEWKW